MKIDTAIEIIQELLENSDVILSGKEEDALNLGIEALKREKKSRDGTFLELLPGETK